MRNFDDLSEREILALAISNEEEDSRIYADFADGLATTIRRAPKSSTEMAAEENDTGARLIDLFVSKFGQHIPLVRATTSAATSRRSLSGRCARWLETVRSPRARDGAGRRTLLSPSDTRTTDASIRKLLGDLAEVEDQHDQIASASRGEILTDAAARQRRRARAPAVHLADHPAGPRRADGRLGVDARAGVRGGLRDPQFLERFRRRTRGLGRRRHLDGLCGGAGGRRQALGPRRAAAARRRLRPDDDGGRHRPHPALPYPRFLHGDGRRRLSWS